MRLIIRRESKEFVELFKEQIPLLFFFFVVVFSVAEESDNNVVLDRFCSHLGKFRE